MKWVLIITFVMKTATTLPTTQAWLMSDEPTCDAWATQVHKLWDEAISKDKPALGTGGVPWLPPSFRPPDTRSEADDVSQHLDTVCVELHENIANIWTERNPPH